MAIAPQWSKAAEEAAAALTRELESGALETLRFVFADPHGILRGKTLVAAEAVKALTRGVALTTTLILKDTSQRTAFPVFSAGALDMPQLHGAADMLMLADPTTWRPLPWTNRSAIVLCDLAFKDGSPVPISTRRVAKGAIDALARRGYRLVTGLEAEFHVFRVVDAGLSFEQTGQPGEPPAVAPLSRGAEFLTEQAYDQLDPIVELLRKPLMSMGLPLRSMEVEFGPSQLEFTFGTGEGIETADNMLLFRIAVKEICRRNGLHATFMCRPKIPNVASSGWHLHQSLVDEAGRNLFTAEGGDALSPLGRHYLGGLLAHARGASALAAPTINAYRRYRPNSLAPDRANWGHDNRGAMLRVIGGADDPATRIENRVGEPAANPYLYLASQAISGLDGIERRLDPGPPVDAPYETAAAALPGGLPEALAALEDDTALSKGLGDGFVAYFRRLKEFELRRFEAEVSEWEHREYFNLF
jgi:glutamine synthetase